MPYLMTVVSVMASLESNATATKTACKNKLEVEHGWTHGEGTLELYTVDYGVCHSCSTPSLPGAKAA